MALRLENHTMASEIVVNEFVAEAREHLSNTERDLLVMEDGRDADDPDTVHRVFRAIHSIKGASGTFGFPSIMELSHAMESVLVLMRDGKMAPDANKINVLLGGVDKLRFMIEDIYASNEMDYASEVRELKAILPGEGGMPDSPSEACTGRLEPGPPAVESISLREIHEAAITLKVKDPNGSDEMVFEADKEALSSAVSRRHCVCAIRVDHDRDLVKKQCTMEDLLAKLQSYGQCLGTDNGRGDKLSADDEAPADRPCYLLFATILEPDLIGAALDLPDEQVQIIDSELLRELLQGKPASPDPLQSPPPATGTASSKQVEKATHPAPETIRVDVALLDTLINLAGELVLGRNQLRQILDASMDENPRLRTVIQNVNLVTSEMQEHILQMRMQPVNSILNRLPRLVRDLARQLDKEVELITRGGEVELDKSILEGLIDPLVHIIRNSVDHGIEAPRDRTAKGKPPKGEIHLRAFHEGGQVNITISDDGRGMDIDAVVAKAMARGVLSVEEARRMSEKEKINLVLLPGFSTAKTVTDISGRGVGMDVVKSNIERFGGHVEIDSLPGAGTTIRIIVPLTLAIIPSLIVGAGSQRFAIPQVNVRELVCIRAEDAGRRIEKVGDAPVLRLRERLLPLVRLADTVGLARSFVSPASGEETADRRINIADRRGQGKDSTVCEADRRQPSQGRRHSRQSDIFVVVLRVGGDMFGLIVDELFDIEEIVVKPLLKHIKNCQCFAGATIMGDGRVAMILDAAGVAALAKLRFAEVSAEQMRRQREDLHRQKSSAADLQSIIVFNIASQERFAVPLSGISRLEKISPQAVEWIGNHEFITYCGKPLPLVRLESFLPVRPLPPSPEELYVIIPKMAGGPGVGIIASSIVDAMQLAVVVEKATDTPRGFLGSAVVEGRITTFLDMEELLKMFRTEIRSSGAR